MSSARADVLARVRRQLASAPAGLSRAEDYARLPRLYRQSAGLSSQARTALMVERLRDYDADVFETGEQGIAQAVGSALDLQKETVLLVPETLPDAWLPPGIEVLRDTEQASRSTLIRAQAVLTPCAVAIAETGTLVLTHGADQGRRIATLLPDHHICVLRASQIVSTVPEALALLSPTAPLTTISGPSATADIEMVRIRGVHGPRRLTVLLLA